VLIGQPQFGFSITSALRTVGHGIYQAHAIPTRALVRAAKDPRVQQAAVAAGQSYVASDPRAQQYIQQARAFLPPGAPPPSAMPAPVPGGDDDAGPPVSTGPVQKGNMITIAAVVGVGLLAFLLLRK